MKEMSTQRPGRRSLTRHLAACAAVGLLASACADGGSGADTSTPLDTSATADTNVGGQDTAAIPTEPYTQTVLNAGTKKLEGHTAQGFSAEGFTLRVGDDGVEGGDGLQVFLSMETGKLGAGKVTDARLLVDKDYVHTEGDPIRYLRPMILDEVVYSGFGKELWNLEPVAGGVSCEFVNGEGGPYQCIVTPAVERARAEGRAHTQFRLRWKTANNGDKHVDAITFYKSSDGENEPGIFTLTATIDPTK